MKRFTTLVARAARATVITGLVLVMAVAATGLAVVAHIQAEEDVVAVVAVGVGRCAHPGILGTAGDPTDGDASRVSRNSSAAKGQPQPSHSASP